MKKQFRFQIENGYIFDGPFEIAINNYIGEIEAGDITTATQYVIDAHGGQEIVEEIKPKRKSKKTSKNKSDGNGELREVSDLLEKVNEVTK